MDKYINLEELMKFPIRLDHYDKECVYTKECLDRELQQYCGSSFEPYEKRYFEED